MKMQSLLDHYKMLWFFQFHRFEGDNYRKMRDYFAEVLIREFEEFVDIKGRRVLDVGGANGEFCKILQDKRGCDAVNLDPFPENIIWPATVKAWADAMPLPDCDFDALVCRGVIEHIDYEKQLPSLKEMFRVAKPGACCYMMTQPWWNPHAGHHLKPFHIFPFPIAKKLRKLIGQTVPIKGNSYADERLFGRSFSGWEKLFLASGFHVEKRLDTHFKLHFLTRIPLIREILVPSVVWILKK